MITADRLLESVSIGVSERPMQARSSLVEYRSTVCSLLMGSRPREWGQQYRFCPPLQSINMPLSGQPGSLWLSDFPYYKQVGKQPLNFAIIRRWSLYQCFPSSRTTFLSFIYMCTNTHTPASWYCYSVVDGRAEQ